MLTRQQIREAIPHALLELELPRLGPGLRGKVRDMWEAGRGTRLLVATDRVSAFDRVVGAIPFRGQVLNQLAAWWFEKTRDVVPNHLLSVPDPNVSLVREARPLPVEVVVRGHITGMGSTSLWTLYHQGVKRPYGLDLPPGLRKNDPLPRPVITPTTKATGTAHDERLTPQEVVQRGLVPAGLWRQVERVALSLFARGQQVARDCGLILVDTKYELGLIDDELALIDEVHTPDSSRFWVATSYEAIRRAGIDNIDTEIEQEPEQLDKEVLRRYLAEQGYRGEGEAPELPADVVVDAAERYIRVYERLTSLPFVPGEQPAGGRIRAALAREAQA